VKNALLFYYLLLLCIKIQLLKKLSREVACMHDIVTCIVHNLLLLFIGLSVFFRLNASQRKYDMVADQLTAILTVVQSLHKYNNIGHIKQLESR